jgi:hypothetical protein
MLLQINLCLYFVNGHFIANFDLRLEKSYLFRHLSSQVYPASRFWAFHHWRNNHVHVACTFHVTDMNLGNIFYFVVAPKQKKQPLHLLMRSHSAFIWQRAHQLRVNWARRRRNTCGRALLCDWPCAFVHGQQFISITGGVCDAPIIIQFAR